WLNPAIGLQRRRQGRDRFLCRTSGEVLHCGDESTRSQGMKQLIPVVLLSVATGAFAAAQLYRWVDDKGNVEYRDTPPPQNAKKVEERRVVTSTIETSSPSYAVQQAAKNFPVTLWAYECGDPCKNAR